MFFQLLLYIHVFIPYQWQIQIGGRGFRTPHIKKILKDVVFPQKVDFGNLCRKVSIVSRTQFLVLHAPNKSIRHSDLPRWLPWVHSAELVYSMYITCAQYYAYKKPLLMDIVGTHH